MNFGAFCMDFLPYFFRAHQISLRLIYVSIIFMCMKIYLIYQICIVCYIDVCSICIFFPWFGFAGTPLLQFCSSLLQIYGASLFNAFVCCCCIVCLLLLYWLSFHRFASLMNAIKMAAFFSQSPTFLFGKLLLSL